MSVWPHPFHIPMLEVSSQSEKQNNRKKTNVTTCKGKWKVGETCQGPNDCLHWDQIVCLSHAIPLKDG